MITKVNLSQVKSCDQDWDSMTPCERGRVCGKCKKTIIDFRGKSDAEVARLHAYSEENLCGIYNEKQLDLNHIEGSKINSSLWKSILVSIGRLFSSANLNSQPITIDQNKDIIEIPWNQNSVSEIKPDNVISNVEKKPIIVQGVVRDKNGDPLPYATVVLKNSTIGTNTDINGKYVIDLTNYFEHNDFGELEIRFIGIATKKIELYKSSFNGAIVNVIATKIEPQINQVVFKAYVSSEKSKLGKIKNWFSRKRNKNSK